MAAAVEDTCPPIRRLRAAFAIARAVLDGAIVALPSRRFPLTEIAQAHEFAETGPTGRVLVDIP